MTNKKRIFCILTAAVIALALAAVGLYFWLHPGSTPVMPVPVERNAVTAQPAAPRTPEGEIVLISRHVNYAWGYDDAGVFVDSAGNVYPFDFHAQYGGLGGRSDLATKLELIRKWVEPAGRCAPSQMEKFIAASQKISDRENYHSEEKMYDYGEKQLIFRDPDSGEELLLGEWGDVDRTLTDPAAPAAIAKGRAIADGAARLNDGSMTLRVYTPDDVPFRTLDTPEGMEGRYLLRSADQLYRLQEELGVPLGDMADDLEDYERERYAFFVDLAAVGEPTAIFCRNGAFSVLTEGSGEPHCIIAAFPLAGYDMSKDAYETLSGEEWTLYEPGDPNFDADVHRGLTEGADDAAVQRVWADYNMHGYRGIYLDSQADYDAFLDACDRYALLKNGHSLRERLEADFQPDFGEYALSIHIARRPKGMFFWLGRIRIADGSIDIGLVSDPETYDWSLPADDGVVAWLWLPKTYLDAGKDYVVQ